MRLAQYYECSVYRYNVLASTRMSYAFIV